MKKKILMVLITASLALISTGCAKGETEENLVQPIVIELAEGQENDTGEEKNREETAGEPKEEAPLEGASKEEIPSEAAGTAKIDVPAKAEEDTGESTGKSDTAQTDPEKAAYYSVLKNLYETYTLPGGTNLGYDGFLDISENQFAIYDIDKDGEEELIILWATTITAGMSEIVYGFDSASGTVREELWEYPMQTFYNNGIVEVGLSHNHGLAGDLDFWPYIFYRYDQNTDTYVAAAEVDAWNKSFYEKDFNDKSFPNDIDTDGDGVVYKVCTGDGEKLMDLGEYKKWRDSFVGGAEKIEIPFQKMTEENVYVQ